MYNPDDPLAAAQMLRSSPPTGPLTPPMTPLRAAGAGGLAGGLTPEALAALLGQQQQAGGGMAGVPGMQGMGAPAGNQGERLPWSSALLAQLPEARLAVAGGFASGWPLSCPPLSTMCRHQCALHASPLQMPC